MTTSVDLARTMLPIAPVVRRSAGRRRIAGVLLAAALAVAASQSGCDNSSYSSPTAPLPQPTPTPLPSQVVTGAAFRLLVEPTSPEDSYPRAGELFVDGREVWVGRMGTPIDEEWGISYNVAHLLVGTLLPGEHTLTLRVTDQVRSPTSYDIDGLIVLNWGPDHTSLAGLQQRRNVSLATGQRWTVQFVVPTKF